METGYPHGERTGQGGHRCYTDNRQRHPSCDEIRDQGVRRSRYDNIPRYTGEQGGNIAGTPEKYVFIFFELVLPK